jgi:predicted amidophosphoribosyltransferase
VCAACWASLRGGPLVVERFANDHAVCWACAVDHYEGRMKEIVHALKYERGFNQAEELAIHLGLPVARLLKRVRHTPSQIDLPKDQRQRNVIDAFAVNPSPGSRLQVPGIVVLVDDVSTTGSTLESCARVLTAAGVKEVRALTAARVVNARR